MTIEREKSKCVCASATQNVNQLLNVFFFQIQFQTYKVAIQFYCMFLLELMMMKRRIEFS